jgi:hypothetical protein
MTDDGLNVHHAERVVGVSDREEAFPRQPLT